MKKTTKPLFLVLGFIVAITIIFLLKPAPKDGTKTIMTNISYTDFESTLMDADKFEDYRASLGENLDYEEIVHLSENYIYKRIEHYYQLEKTEVVVGALLKIDNQNNIAYSYPYIKSYKNDWKTLATSLDILDLYKETKVIILATGEYIGDNKNNYESETIRLEFTLSKTLSELIKVTPL